MRDALCLDRLRIGCLLDLFQSFLIGVTLYHNLQQWRRNPPTQAMAKVDPKYAFMTAEAFLQACAVIDKAARQGETWKRTSWRSRYVWAFTTLSESIRRSEPRQPLPLA